MIIFVFTNLVLLPHSSHADHDEDDDRYEIRTEYEQEDAIEDEEDDSYNRVSSPPIKRDSIPPTLRIISPKNDSHVPFETTEIRIKVEVIDDTDSSPKLVGDGRHGLAVGINVFPLTATDASGNVSTTSLMVTRNKEEPKAIPEEIATEEVMVDENSKDSDGDGLNDFEEGIFRTNPKIVDTDGDGISDGDEVSLLLNPLGSGKLFSDLTSSHYAAADILEFIKSGYVQGFGDGSFGTQKALTRAEAAKLIVRSRNIPISDSTSSTNHFSDVHAHDWFAPYIGSLVASGIAKGYGDGTFGVHSPITRSEMVKMILMSYGIGTGFEDKSPQDTHFTDLDPLAWQASYVEYAAANNVVNGYENGGFGPHDFVTRGDAIKILASAKQMLEIPANRKAIAFMTPQERLARLELKKQDNERLIALEQAKIIPQQRSAVQKNSPASTPAKVNTEPKITPAPTPSSTPVIPQNNSAQIAAQQEADRKAAAEQEAAKLAAEAAARATAEAEAKAKAEAMARAAAKQKTQTQTRAS